MLLCARPRRMSRCIRILWLNMDISRRALIHIVSFIRLSSFTILTNWDRTHHTTTEIYKCNGDRLILNVHCTHTIRTDEQFVWAGLSIECWLLLFILWNCIQWIGWIRLVLITAYCVTIVEWAKCDQKCVQKWMNCMNPSYSGTDTYISHVWYLRDGR